MNKVNFTEENLSKIQIIVEDFIEHFIKTKEIKLYPKNPLKIYFIIAEMVNKIQYLEEKINTLKPSGKQIDDKTVVTN